MRRRLAGWSLAAATGFGLLAAAGQSLAAGPEIVAVRDAVRLPELVDAPERVGGREIVGDVERVFDRAIIVVNERPIRLFGVLAPRVGEPFSGSAQLLLREATLGQRVRCEPLSHGLAGDGEPGLIARCRVGAMDLSALLVSSGYVRPCVIDGEQPYGRLAPRATRGRPAGPSCPRPSD